MTDIRTFCFAGKKVNIKRSCRLAKAPSSQTSIQGIRLSSESAESYETLALWPRCQTNFSSSFSPPSSPQSSTSLDPLSCHRSARVRVLADPRAGYLPGVCWWIIVRDPDHRACSRDDLGVLVLLREGPRSRGPSRRLLTVGIGRKIGKW